MALSGPGAEAVGSLGFNRAIRLSKNTFLTYQRGGSTPINWADNGTLTSEAKNGGKEKYSRVRLSNGRSIPPRDGSLADERNRWGRIPVQDRHDNNRVPVAPEGLQRRMVWNMLTSAALPVSLIVTYNYNETTPFHRASA